MKKTLLLALGALCHIHASAQENLAIIADSIRREGVLLYQHIQARQTGVALFEADTTGRLSLQASGYFSYRSGSDYVLIMPHRGSLQNPVVTSYRFDAQLTPQTAKMEVGRSMTAAEMEIWELWNHATELVQKDTRFKKARDTHFMIVPVVEGDVRKVYILSTPSRSNTFVLGNDYLLQFNGAREEVAMTEFHTNLLMTPKGRKSSGHIHGRSNSPYITATDICAFMLHPKAFDQESMRVVSPTHISEWNMATNTLYIEQRMQ